MYVHHKNNFVQKVINLIASNKLHHAANFKIAISQDPNHIVQLAYLYLDKCSTSYNGISLLTIIK